MRPISNWCCILASAPIDMRKGRWDLGLPVGWVLHMRGRRAAGTALVGEATNRAAVNAVAARIPLPHRGVRAADIACHAGWCRFLRHDAFAPIERVSTAFNNLERNFDFLDFFGFLDFSSRPMRASKAMH
jgi:hypothetical protein